MTPAKTPRPARALGLIAVHVACDGFEFGPEGPAARRELTAYNPKTLLAAIWKRLTPATRNALEAAWHLEVAGAPLRAARARSTRKPQGVSPAIRRAPITAVKEETR